LFKLIIFACINIRFNLIIRKTKSLKFSTLTYLGIFGEFFGNIVTRSLINGIVLTHWFITYSLDLVNFQYVTLYLRLLDYRLKFLLLLTNGHYAVIIQLLQKVFSVVQENWLAILLEFIDGKIQRLARLIKLIVDFVYFLNLETVFDGNVRKFIKVLFVVRVWNETLKLLIFISLKILKISSFDFILLLKLIIWITIINFFNF